LICPSERSFSESLTNSHRLVVNNLAGASGAGGDAPNSAIRIINAHVTQGIGQSHDLAARKLRCRAILLAELLYLKLSNLLEHIS
jgi:hypothetical protein